MKKNNTFSDDSSKYFFGKNESTRMDNLLLF